MKGALVFLAVFIILFAATLAYNDLPPGKQIYDALNVPTTDYPVLGIQATTLIEAVVQRRSLRHNSMAHLHHSRKDYEIQDADAASQKSSIVRS